MGVNLLTIVLIFETYFFAKVTKLIMMDGMRNFMAYVSMKISTWENNCISYYCNCAVWSPILHFLQNEIKPWPYLVDPIYPPDFRHLLVF